MSEPVGGLFRFGGVREPSQSERDFFTTGRGVKTPAYAAPDGSVVFNPMTSAALSEQERASLVSNERARMLMQRGLAPRPTFALTPSQAEKWRWYSEDQNAVRETIAARLASGDPSVDDATPEQMEFSQQLRRFLENRSWPDPKGGLAK